jgi:hypothetical protein
MNCPYKITIQPDTLRGGRGVRFPLPVNGEGPGEGFNRPYRSAARLIRAPLFPRLQIGHGDAQSRSASIVNRLEPVLMGSPPGFA